jgi:glutamate formiminotransferase/formiminotetrahydrofolate cyclodeaminase
VLFESAKHYLKLTQFTPDQVLERQVAHATVASNDSKPATSPDAFIAAVASPEPAPGGGSVAAYAGALAAALTRMVAGLTIGKKKYAGVEEEMSWVAASADALIEKLQSLVTSDAVVYTSVSTAYKRPKTTEAEIETRKSAIETALIAAAEVPLETARACAGVADLALTVATQGNSNAITDAGVAAVLAQAGCRAAAWNVRINVASLDDRSRGEHLVSEAVELTHRIEQVVGNVAQAVERALE